MKIKTAVLLCVWIMIPASQALVPKPADDQPEPIAITGADVIYAIKPS
jgi:hypothetical protein